MYIKKIPEIAIDLSNCPDFKNEAKSIMVPFIFPKSRYVHVVPVPLCPGNCQTACDDRPPLPPSREIGQSPGLNGMGIGPEKFPGEFPGRTFPGKFFTGFPWKLFRRFSRKKFRKNLK